MSIYFFGFLAGIVAVFLEWRYATHDSYFSWPVLPYALLLGPIITYCIFRLVKESPNLIVAVVVFSFCTLVLRVFVTLVILRQPVSPGSWAALALLLASQVARRW